MNKLTAEVARMDIGHLKLFQANPHVGLSLKEEKYLQALEIALPVLEQQESRDVFIVVRKPGHQPYIKRPVGDAADSLLQIYQHSPEVSCDVVTYLFPGALGQWVKDGRELLTELEMTQPSTTPQIDNDGWIEWGGGECAPVTGAVEVRWNTGSTSIGKASDWRWEYSKWMVSIIAYRVIENDGREG